MGAAQPRPRGPSWGEKVTELSGARRWVTAALGVGLVAGGVAGANAETEFTERIAAVSDRDGGYDLYLIEPASGKTYRLTTDGGEKGQPALSPSGDAVAFVQDDDIMLVSTSGGTPKKLTDTPEAEAQPAWSPDGTKLVFERAYPVRRRVEVDLVIRPVVGGPEKRIEAPGSDERAPDWSGAVDHHPIVFTSNRTGMSQVWRANAVADAAGSYDPIQVTTHKDPSYYPAWSPDGTKLSLSRWYPGKVGVALTTHELGTRKEVKLGGGYSDHGSDWSPDGDWIAYRHDAGNGSNTTRVLYRVRSDGSGSPELLPGLIGNYGNPSWGRVPTATTSTTSTTAPPSCPLLDGPMCL